MLCLTIQLLKMKNNCFNNIRLNPGILILATFLLYSCGQMHIPAEMIGNWKTGKIPVTVRTKDKIKRFIFTSDSAVISFRIDDDHTVTGSIGSAKFENAKIKTNWLLPVKMSGLAFTIECGKIGKIFENDPLDSKEVELWLAPLKENTIDAELRYTQGLAYFPMAGSILIKEGE
jgi:hypothetical protein